MYEYQAIVERIVDGDSVRLRVDLGFGTWHVGAFRLVGIAARELNAPGGPEARDNLAALLSVGTAVTIRSVKVDKYGGRYLAMVTLNGDDIARQLVAEGWAVRWSGRGVQPVPDWPRVTGTP